MKACKKNFGFTHKCGVLMPISSLPSPYGIGSFGKGAYDFIDFLDATGQTCWQVLPLNPTSYGDSPYQSPASKAGNPYFIDLELLKKDKLLTAEELKKEKNDSKKIDYGWLFNTRYLVLRLAYSRFTHDADYKSFCRKNASWLNDYSLFMALKVHYNWCSWTSWSEEHRDVTRARGLADEFAAEAGFWKWIQFEFSKQWHNVVEYAHAKGITIIGDIPIYVAHDSVDVWSSPEQFLLDEDYNPTAVAGCPPDAYSVDGQLWGNPLYDWKRMEKESFSWWIDRARAAFSLYDILRIDHFRGFASYYSIPYGDANARRGEWCEAPGLKLFEAIKSEIPRAKIIAEDLGFITDDVRELLSETGFPGMKVLQFGLCDAAGEYNPKNFETDNCVVYSSSHDSDCTASWYMTLKPSDKKRFRKECPRRKGQSATEAVIEAGMRSRANLCIVPMQDYLELSNAEGRMNTPSVAEGNWGWRISPRYATESLIRRISELVANTGR